jgi:hypothetical protein
MRGPSVKEIAARGKAEMQARRERTRSEIAALDILINNAPDVVALNIDALRQQRADLSDLLARETAQLRSPRGKWFYFGLLARLEHEGVRLGYSSKRDGTLKSPTIDRLIDEAAKHGRKIGREQAANLITAFTKQEGASAQFAGGKGEKGELRVDAVRVRDGKVID